MAPLALLLLALTSSPAPAGAPTAAGVRALLDAGRYSEAEAEARGLVQLLAAAPAADALESAKARDLLVEALRRAGKTRDEATLELARESVAVWEELAGPDDIRITTSLGQLALILVARADFAPAGALYERVLAIRERELGPDDPAVAQVLNNLANLKRERGDYRAAQGQYERALAIRERSLGPDHQDVAKTLNDLANDLFQMGSFAEAQSRYERAVAIFEKSIGPEHPLTLSVRANLGALLRERGDYAGARDVLERAQAGLEQALGPDHPTTISGLTKLANLLAEDGDYAQAKQLYERAIAASDRRLGPEHPDVAIPLANLGTLLERLGDARAARAVFERALAVREKGLGPDHPRRAFALQSLADLMLDSDAPLAEIEPLLAQALAIEERALGADHPSVVDTLASIARLERRRGDEARARATLERACGLTEKSLGPEHPRLAALLVRLSAVLEAMGAGVPARSALERALAIRERSLGPGNPDVAATRAALAAFLDRSGDEPAALAAALEAEDAARQHVRLTVRALGERQALLYAQARSSALDLALALSAENPGATKTRRSDVLDSLVRSRALVLDEMALRHRVIVSLDDPAAARLGREMALARARLAHVVVRGAGDGSLERYQKLLEEARRAKEGAEEALAARSLAFREERSRAAVGLREIREALPANAAVLSYVRYARGQEARYAAFVLRAGRDPELIPLGSARPVEDAVAAVSRAIAWESRAPGVAPKRSLARYSRAAAALRGRIWDPVAGSLAASEMVFVVPDGMLHLVNFAALPGADGGFLVEGRPLLHLLSAERDLVSGGADVPGDGLLLVGAPEFRSGGERVARQGFRGATPGCGAFRDFRFSALPGARREVQTIASLWKTYARPGTGTTSLLVLEGREANEAAFKEDAPGRRLVHLATHGFALGGACSGESSGSLLRSGLALAGANRRQEAAPGAEDGILTAEEIAALDLRGVEWAVLAACETGVGDVAAGEGVLGLRRAFQVAGAGSVIMSLWPVGDDVSTGWTRQLYRRRLRDHESTAAAVRGASLDLLRRRRARGESPHPLYWAAFLAAGAWR
jgi:CHAT domain-containing protein/Tfp pilus assembly protein PilF